MNWKTEYDQIKTGDSVTWTDFIYKCIEEVAYPPRKNCLYDTFEDLRTTDFVTAPASTHYHHAYKCGLIKHTCETIALAFSIRKACEANVDYTELLTCSLLHDYGKVGKYKENSEYRSTDSTGYPFKYISRDAELSDQLRSVIYVTQMIPDISEKEIFAILYHDGLYPDENIISKNKETPLQLMIHWADMWSARMDQYGW